MAAIASVTAEKALRRRSHDPRPYPPVEGQEINPVTCPRGQRGEQEHRVHGGIQPGRALA